jgi:DNA processing protein
MPQSQEDSALLVAMGFDPVDLDTLCARSGLTAENASAMLLTLELGGAVARLPGGRFQRIR